MQSMEWENAWKQTSPNAKGARYHFQRARIFLDQVTTQLLLTLDGLKQRLEVSSAKAGEVVSLDDLNEDGGAIHHVL